MEDALQAGRGAGLTFAEVLDTTAYLLRLACKAKGERELAAGWWAERFHREQMLKPLPHYLNGEPEGEVNQAEALKNWIKGNDRRFAREARKARRG